MPSERVHLTNAITRGRGAVAAFRGVAESLERLLSHSNHLAAVLDEIADQPDGPADRLPGQLSRRKAVAESALWSETSTLCEAVAAGWISVFGAQPYRVEDVDCHVPSEERRSIVAMAGICLEICKHSADEDVRGQPAKSPVGIRP